jgi:hypothetical protein
MLSRIGWGFLTALLAMVVAGLVEVYRKSQVPEAKASPSDGPFVPYTLLTPPTRGGPSWEKLSVHLEGGRMSRFEAVCH